MTAELLDVFLPPLLAAGDAASAYPAEAAPQAEGVIAPVLLATAYVALAGLSLGMILCLWRLVRGPTLADRVLAADLLALHVVGVVVVLTIYLHDMVFFEAALAVGILGFVSTVGFAQYIHATAGRPDHPHGNAPDPANVRAPSRGAEGAPA